MSHTHVCVWFTAWIFEHANIQTLLWSKYWHVKYRWYYKHEISTKKQINDSKYSTACVCVYLKNVFCLKFDIALNTVKMMFAHFILRTMSWWRLTTWNWQQRNFANKWQKRFINNLLKCNVKFWFESIDIFKTKKKLSGPFTCPINLTGWYR